jgi:hypothetical protein
MSNSIVLGQACNVGLTLLPDLSKHECLLLLYKITKKKKLYGRTKIPVYAKIIFLFFGARPRHRSISWSPDPSHLSLT